MSGTTIPLFSRREFDFSQVRGGRSLAVMLVKAVDVSQYPRGTLEVRVHGRSISGPGARICVLAHTTAPTADDPTVDFVDDEGPVASIVIDDAHERTPPVLLSAALSAGFGGMLAIVVRGEQPARPVDMLAAELSAFLTLKS